MGDQFEILFSVGIRSNTTPIYNDQRQLVNESNERIDSAGYPVVQAGNLVLRTTTVSSAGSLTNRPDDHPTVQEQQAGNTYANYTGAVFANSGRSAYSSTGMRLHFYRPAAAGIDNNSDGDFNDIGDTPPVSESRIAATVTTAEFSGL